MSEAESPKRRMQAYYYGFSPTGVDAIDKILSAVACAGKSYHHTECWQDECEPAWDHTGNSPAEWIQRAAEDAAAAFRPHPPAPAAPVDGWKDAQWAYKEANCVAEEIAILREESDSFGCTWYITEEIEERQEELARWNRVARLLRQFSEGWRFVPSDPTPAMIAAGYEPLSQLYSKPATTGMEIRAAGIASYKAMLAVAPETEK